MSFSSRAVLTTIILSGLAATANAGTIATFADPSPGPTPSLFQWNGATNTLTGGWAGSGLTLQTPGTSSPDLVDAKFTFGPLVATSVIANIAFFGPGSVQFLDSAMAPVFLIEFDNAMMNTSLSFGASDFLAWNVRFSGSILDWPTQDEAFSFSFANPVATGAVPGFTVTSSFTSSAERLIPSPGGAALLAIGFLALAPRRRA
jgi:hypothetical protein